VYHPSVSVDVHAHWKQFLEQHGFEIRDTLGVERAFGRVPSAASMDSTATRCVDLNHFDAMQLVGPDASTFLQGYLTCDTASLDQTHALFGAYCNIKGRVVADATVLLTHEHPTLLVHASLRATIATSLGKYLAFSRSRFTPPDAAPLLLGIVNPAPDPALPSEPLTVTQLRGGYAIAMPGLQPRVLLVLPAAAAAALWLEYAAQSATADATIWDLLDIRAGIAHVCAATSETFLPQMLDYDQLGGVSFTKGCYLGQEIVARTQHRGRPKRHLHSLRWSGAPTPAIGAPLLRGDGSHAGTLVATAAVATDAGEALAVLNDAGTGTLHADGATFTAQ